MVHYQYSPLLLVLSPTVVHFEIWSLCLEMVVSVFIVVDESLINIKG